MNTLEICNPVTNEPGSIYPYTMEPRPARMSRGEIAQKASPTGIRVKVTKIGVVDDYTIRSPWPHPITAVANRTMIALLFIGGEMLAVSIDGSAPTESYTVAPLGLFVKRKHINVVMPRLRGITEFPAGFPFDGQEFIFPLDEYYDSGLIRAAVTGSGIATVEGFVFGSEEMAGKGISTSSQGVAIRRNCGMNVQLEVEVLG